ncbi:unnamed protein product, partial [Staurois parvus]
MSCQSAPGPYLVFGVHQTSVPISAAYQCPSVQHVSAH